MAVNPGRLQNIFSRVGLLTIAFLLAVLSETLKAGPAVTWPDEWNRPIVMVGYYEAENGSALEPGRLTPLKFVEVYDYINEQHLLGLAYFNSEGALTAVEPVGPIGALDSFHQGLSWRHIASNELHPGWRGPHPGFHRLLRANEQGRWILTPQSAPE